MPCEESIFWLQEAEAPKYAETAHALGCQERIPIGKWRRARCRMFRSSRLEGSMRIVPTAILLFVASLVTRVQGRAQAAPAAAGSSPAWADPANSDGLGEEECEEVQLRYQSGGDVWRIRGWASGVAEAP